MDTTVMIMPVIALRSLTILPRMTVSFDISRSRSVAAVEKAMVSDQKICVVTQKDAEDSNPHMEQLHHIGVIVHVKQLVKMPGGVIRVMVEGIERAELLMLDSEEPALMGEVTASPWRSDDVDSLTGEAMQRVLREKVEAVSGKPLACNFSMSKLLCMVSPFSLPMFCPAAVPLRLSWPTASSSP